MSTRNSDLGGLHGEDWGAPGEVRGEDLLLENYSRVSVLETQLEERMIPKHFWTFIIQTLIHLILQQVYKKKSKDNYSYVTCSPGLGSRSSEVMPRLSYVDTIFRYMMELFYIENRYYGMSYGRKVFFMLMILKKKVYLEVFSFFLR